MVCECVAIFKGVKDPDWKAAKGLMADTNFLSSLQNMDVDGISASQVRERERETETETEKERDREREKEREEEKPIFNNHYYYLY